VEQPAQPDLSPTRQRGALIVGASSGIGAAVARVLAARGYQVALVARRAEALQQLAQELNGGAGTGAPVARIYPHDVCDYAAAPAVFARVVDDLRAGGARLELLIYASGIMPGGRDGPWSFDEERATIETNVVGAMRWLGLAAELFTRQGSGTLAGISSVAGDRGRRGNSVYMASKAALTTYLESLRFRLRGTGVRVVTIKPGFVATPMTRALTLPRPLVTAPDATARQIVEACVRGTSVAYIPRYWAPIMWVIRALPSSVLARLPI
jgi:short-subunit dehydrogenase